MILEIILCVSIVILIVSQIIKDRKEYKRDSLLKKYLKNSNQTQKRM